MIRSVVNAMVTVVAVASLGMFATAASAGHVIRHGAGHHAKNHQSEIAQYHPYVGIPALDAHGWFSTKSLTSAEPATVAAETQTVDLSLCRMTAYLPDYATAFEAACSQGAAVASAGTKKIY
jgi:hypothetical protein